MSSISNNLHKKYLENEFKYNIVKNPNFENKNIFESQKNKTINF
jgi:hypothetical protein